MTNIFFYESQIQPFEKSVSSLLRKCYESGDNTFVKCRSEDEVDLIDKTIWTFSQKFFIPHSREGDDFPEKQPILLSTNDFVKNDAKILVLISTDFENINEFDRVIIIFDEKDNNQRDFCRNLYKKYKSLNFKINYFKQATDGSWEAK